ncbi:MAG TPA: quinoprotein dehydrogenase-associated putative ABC transporter substrate-binding protein [Albitalea sp.]|uniref:quinoprotein dehydrogenase-associated putative ABC transporter substrate-binding protein n=1 Tax=Piscinibacter sp. TaxID=1903157 RepID=UPI002ED28892
MSSRFLRPLVLTALIAASALAAAAPSLRVCADPDNLPYSHADGSGFENRIARLVADELGLPLAITWMPLGRGFVRKTLGANECDVLAGVPADFERVLATRPYYRSSYVFVTRADAARPLRSFDDPRLARLRVGVQLVGNDLAATPPGHALVQRGATARVIGYTPLGDGPAAERMLAALAHGELDAALVWGPQAGYFAARSPVPLRLAVAEPPAGLRVPFDFAISMGVRRGDTALRDQLDAALARRRADIDAVLADYGVPRVDGGGR